MRIYSAAIEGLHLTLTQVEADISNGLPSFIISGLGGTAIKEARDRIRSALKNSGFNFPANKKLVNLAPADIKKHGSHFDLPIAISLLKSSNQIKPVNQNKIFLAGELMLDGSVRTVPGILPLVFFAKKKGFESVYIPDSNKAEASLVTDIQIFPIKNIREIIGHFESKNFLKPYNTKQNFINNKKNYGVNFSDIFGQEIPKRVLEISASGQHHCILTGPPGTGKTMLSKAYCGILPHLNKRESIEVSMIYSISPHKHNLSLPIQHRPFRHIHHSTTGVTLLGGGTPLQLGEATMAHHGVLFLDEFGEFGKSVLENLREPLQEGKVRLGRRGKTAVLPAKFQLIAAMNPCPCGYYGDSKKNCICTPYEIKRYYKKISGPVMDRIDLIVEVPRISNNKLRYQKTESTEEILKRVLKVREIQKMRGVMNNELNIKSAKEVAALSKASENFLEKVYEKLNLSPRSYLNILKVSRTIADMERSVRVHKKHIAEAVQYRRNYFL